MKTNLSKHAYLIMAHNKFDQLQRLMNLLDDPRNDIYLHVDKKALDFSPEIIHVQYAGLYLVDRIGVNWGGYSQIRCELKLLAASAKGHYQYYHLISGQDMPIKTQDEIHAFFEEQSGKNYIGYDHEANKVKDFYGRSQYYFFFQEVCGRGDDSSKAFFILLEKIFYKLQHAFQIQRKSQIPLYKGANWFSITDEMAQYIVSMEQQIYRQFCFTINCDEVFLQSYAWASPYRGTIVEDNYRCIDWKRGNPYVFRKEDVPQLLASPMLFARKFDVSVDQDAVYLIEEYLTPQKHHDKSGQ